VRTPEHLRSKYGLPERTGAAFVPRVYFHYNGEDKARKLSTVIVMTVAGCLRAHGADRSWNHKVTQAKLAARSGLARRETITRRISLMATDRIHTGAALVHRKRRGIHPDMYSPALPESLCFQGCTDPAQCSHKRRSEKYYAPALEQLMANEETKQFWQQCCDIGSKGYKDIPYWIFDERLPLNDNDRLVFVFYLFCGLLDPSNNQEMKKKKEGKFYRVKGVVNPKQETVAKACGLSIETVRTCNKHLAALGLIQVGYSQVRKIQTAAGEDFRSGPQRIVYAPSLTLGWEEAVLEHDRLLAAANAARRDSNANWIEKAIALHAEHLRAWQGDRHRMEAFWRHIRTVYAQAGISQFLIDSLVPHQHSPPG